MKKLLLLFLALLVISCTQTTTEDEYITLGFIGPLTGSAAEYGYVEKVATEIALEEINAAGGINRKQVRVIFEDGECNGKDAASAANKLIHVDKVQVILGGACSGETLGAAPIAEENKVVLLTAFSSNPNIKDAGDYVFRSSINDNQGGEALAKVVIKDHKTAAVITEQTDYAVAFGEVFKREFEERGGKVLAEELYAQDAQDFRSQLTKIKATNPEAVIFNPQSGKTGGRSWVQAKQLNVPGEYYTTFVATGSDFKELIGDYEGIKFIDAPALEKGNPKAAELLRKYVEREGEEPAMSFPTGSRYDTVYMIKEAIEAVGYDGTAIKDYLYGISYEGAIATHEFDEYGEPKGIEYIGATYKNGEMVRLD